MLEETSWVGSKYLGYGSHAYPLPSRRSPNQHQLRGWEGKPGLQQIIQAPWSREKVEGGKGRRCNQRERGETPHTHRRGHSSWRWRGACLFPSLLSETQPFNPRMGFNAPLPKRVRKTPSECGLNSKSPFSGAVPIKLNLKSKEHQRTDAFKMWCWRKLESPLDCKEIKPVNPRGKQPLIFIGRTDAEAETPILWPPDAKD